jgi:predicted outer membrane protein
MIRVATLAALTAVVLAAPAGAQVQTQRQTRTGAIQGAQGAGVQGAQGAGVQGAQGAARSAVSDELFAAAAASGGLAEVNLSQIGLQRATDPELKRFSQQMVEEHTRMNQQLMNLVGQKRIAIPQTIDARAQFCADSLAGLTGEEFDKCYAKAQLVLHMDSVAMFEAEAKRGQDPDVKALASQSLTHIKQHLKEIKPIAMRYEKEKHEESASSGRQGQ